MGQRLTHKYIYHTKTDNGYLGEKDTRKLKTGLVVS
jgi:hypothetical protein